TAVVAFEVAVQDPVPDVAKEIVAQGIVFGPSVPGIVTDDPGTLAVSDATRLRFGSQPRLEAAKTGSRSPDGFLYEIHLRNVSPGQATGVMFDDTPETPVTLLAGSVETSTGTVVSGNSHGDEHVTVDVGAIGAGETV